MKLIDKDKFEMLLVRLKKQHYNTTEFQSGYIKALSDTLSILDTLEVKEVDLDKPLGEVKIHTSMESGSLDEVILTTKYIAQKGE